MVIYVSLVKSLLLLTQVILQEYASWIQKCTQVVVKRAIGVAVQEHAVGQT